MSMSLNITDIQLFNTLKKKLGEKEAQELVSFVKSEVESEFNLKKEILATKDDIANVKIELANNKSEIIKWMFVFVFTSTLTTIGAILAIIRFFMK